MLENLLRPKFDQYFIQPLLPPLNRAHVSPLLITCLGLILGLGASIALLCHQTLLASLLLLLSGYADALDGALARHLQHTSPLGTCLDICFDRCVETAILLSLAIVSGATMLVMTMLASCYLCVTAFLVVGLLSNQMTHKQFYYSPGMMERPEAFLWFLLIIWLPNAIMPLAISFSLLVCLTAYNHIKCFCQQLKESPQYD